MIHHRHIYLVVGIFLVLAGFSGVWFSSMDSDFLSEGITGAAVQSRATVYEGEPGPAYARWRVEKRAECERLPMNKFLIFSNYPVDVKLTDARTGCCPANNNCISIEGYCHSFGEVMRGNPRYVCGSSINWDYCLNQGEALQGGQIQDSAYKQPGSISDDGSKICQNGQWVENANVPDALPNAQQALQNSCDNEGTAVLLGSLTADSQKLCVLGDGESSLNACDEGSEGRVFQRYACNDGAWEQCNAAKLNQLTADSKSACIGNQWQTCPDEGHHLPSPQGVPFCSEGTWHVCSASNAGEVFGSDEAQCVGGWWTTQFTVSEANKLYELSFVKNVAAKQTTIGAAIYGAVSLCDEGTAQVSTHATLCHGSVDRSTRTSVPSMSVLANGQLRPTVIANNNAILYYAEGTPKKVSIVLLKAWRGDSFTAELGPFAQNLLQGRRLAFTIGDEYYVVSHPQAEVLTPAQIVVTHLPTMRPFTLRHVGSNWYQAEVLGGKFVALRVNDNQNRVVFQKGNRGEQLQAYPVPFNLAEQFEVVFKSDAPVVLEDIQNQVLTVCAQDNPNDPQVMQLCFGNEPQPRYTLQKDVSRNDGLLAILYQRIEQAGAEGQPVTMVKQGHIFKVQTPGVAEESASDLLYNPFITAVTSGKRVAISFGGKTYLLEHTGQEFSLSNLKLVKYAAEGKTEIPATGNELKVSFRTADGEVYLKRVLGNNAPPPFKLWARTNDQLGQVDMDAQLFTSFNSLAHVAVAIPQLGNVQKDQADVARNRDLFKINVPGLAANRLQNLAFKVPKPITAGDKSLVMYYDGATRSGEDFVKSVKIYRFYDVVPNSFRPYNDAFLDVFTKGNDLSLKFKESFYLLGYRGEEGGFFSVEDIALTSLDGETEFEGEADIASQSKTFTVGEGQINVSIDDEGGKLWFKSRTEADLVTQNAAELQVQGIEALQLRADNSILINGITYTICDTPSVEAQQANVLLCKSDNAQKLLFARGRVETEYVPGYLVLYKGRNEENVKVVTFQKVQQIDFGDELPAREFAQLGARVGEGQAGAYKWDQKYFELTAADPAQLSTYALRLIPDGQMYPIGNVLTDERELSSGLIVWDEKVINVTQEFDDEYNVQLKVEGMPYMLLPAAGVNVTMGAANQQYRTRAGTVPFMLELIRPVRGSSLLTINVESLDGEITYFSARLPNATRQEILLPDNQALQLMVMNSTDGVVHLR